MNKELIDILLTAMLRSAKGMSDLLFASTKYSARAARQDYYGADLISSSGAPRWLAMKADGSIQPRVSSR